MLCEARAAARPGHGVPLVADAAGVQHKRKFLIDPAPRSRGVCRNKPGPAIGVHEASIIKQAWCTRVSAIRHRPLDRLEALVLFRSQSRQTADIETARAAVFRGRKARVLVKNLSWRPVAERLDKAHPLGHLADDPPIGSSLSRKGSEGALAGNATLGVCDRAVLLSPGGGGQQYVCQIGCIRAGHAI